MGSYAVYLTLVHYDYAVCMFNTGYSLCNYYLCCVRYLSCKRLPDPGVRCSINRTGRIIQYKYLRLLKKCPGNTKTLLLASGYVGAALFYICIVTIRHTLDKFIRTGKLAGTSAHFISGFLVAPSQVLVYGSAEQCILLQNHRNLISQGFHVIFSHIYATYPYTSISHIIQTADKIHKTGLGTSCTSDYTDSLS